MATSSQGLAFSFGGTTLTVTSIQVNDSTDLIDATHLGIPTSSRRIFQAAFAGEREITVEYLGTTLVSTGATGQAVISGAGVSITGNATCQSSSLSGSVGALITGNATFRVA